MDNKLTRQSQIIELLANNEEAVQKLYLLYATKYPESKEFWSKLAQEEAGHAFMIRNLELEATNKPGKVLFKPDRFTPEAIQSSINYINQLIKEFPDKNYPLITALSLAMQIEQSLIEKKYFEVVEGDDIVLQNTLNTLRNDSQEHFERVKKAWENERERRRQNKL